MMGWERKVGLRVVRGVRGATLLQLGCEVVRLPGYSAKVALWGRMAAGRGGAAHSSRKKVWSPALESPACVGQCRLQCRLQQAHSLSCLGKDALAEVQWPSSNGLG